MPRASMSQDLLMGRWSFRDRRSSATFRPGRAHVECNRAIDAQQMRMDPTAMVPDHWSGHSQNTGAWVR